MREKFRKKNIIKIILALLLCFGLYLGGLQLFGNFHVVIPAKVYRSAQLKHGDIAYYKQKYGIKSILNLRGDNAGSKWYDDEVADSRTENVTHLNFRMSAKRQLDQKSAIELIAIMRNAPKPLLIHCRSGSDRTGLASAIYVAAIEKGSEEDAEGQLSILYGHLSWWFIKEYAMDRTFEALEPFLGYSHS